MRSGDRPGVPVASTSQVAAFVGVTLAAASLLVSGIILLTEPRTESGGEPVQQSTTARRDHVAHRATVGDPYERAYLRYLDGHQARYPDAATAVRAGRTAAPVVCFHIAHRPDGLAQDVLDVIPTWAHRTESSKHSFVAAVAYHMCDGPNARRPPE
jgi:hypothetical protein